MKLPAMISNNTTARLEKARAERDRISVVVTELCAKLNSLDVEADDYSAASLTLDGQIHVHQKALGIADQQIAGLESKLAAEEAAERARRRAAAVKQVEAMLPERLEIIKQGVTVAKAVVGFSEKLAAWRKRFLKQYPADLEHPFAHHLSDDWVLRNILAAIRLQPEEAHEILDELVPAAAQMHADAIRGLARPTCHSGSDYRERGGLNGND